MARHLSYEGVMRRIVLGFVFLAACGTHSQGPDGGAGDAAGDGAHGGVCGGLAGVKCSATEYCDFADNGCGVGDKTGTCQTRPQVCPLLIASRPTCACDGSVYSGECDTYEGGFDLNAHGTCPVQTGWFACGYVQCTLTSYCKHDLHAGAADTYSCVALPAGCATPASCACIANEPCGRACTGDGKVGLTVTCPG